MKNLLYAFTAVLLIFTSCSKENVSGGLKYKNEIITASIEQKSNSTRISIDNENNLSWTAGDIFTFFTISGNTYNYGYSSENDHFTPVDNNNVLPDYADVTMVSYPYVAGNTYENKVLTVTLPNTLDFTEDENKNPIQIPMWGTFNNSSVAFKHLAGILRVNLSNIPVGYNQITIEASKTIAGTFNADFSDENNDNVYLVHKESEQAYDNIIVKFNPVTGENNNKTLYLPLPVGTYESIVLSLQEMDNSGNKISEKILANWSDKTVQRARIYTANATYQEASNIAAANTILDGLNNNNKNIHVVIGDVENTNPPSVSVPVVEGSTVVMDFSSVAANEELTISQENAGNTPKESVQNLIVNVDDTNESSMTINTPTATVELGAGNFTTITATTATNTLIVKSGVQIDNLIINGGNVVIEEGAEVTSLTNNGSGNTICRAVKTEEGLISALSTSDNIVLLNDITLSTTVIIEKAATLDLNGFTISPANNFEYFDGDNEFYCMLLIDAKQSGNDITVTIKNGTIDGETDKVKTSFYAEGGYNFGGTLYGEKRKNLTLNVENLKVKNTRTDGIGAAMVIAGGSFNFDDKTEIITSGTYGTIECSADGTLNVNGATITHGDSKPSPSVGFALGAAYGSTINVTAGNIKSDEYCLYALPSGGIINVSGGTFNGKIIADNSQSKDVQVNISGGTFSVDPTEYLVGGKTAVLSGSTWTVKE